MKNKGVEISNLVVEVTRRCNMRCAHCLRGPAQNMDIDFRYIDKLLNQVTHIREVTFTGGEPSLNVPALEYFLEQCIKKEIKVEYFSIITNAKKISVEFLVFLTKMYAYCYSNSFNEESLCSISPSRDKFHEEVPEENWNILKAFSFFQDNKSVDYDGENQHI